MDPTPYLSTVIFVATIATVILAIFSYAAFKLRDQRAPRSDEETPVFFRRYHPEAPPPPDTARGAGWSARPVDDR